MDSEITYFMSRILVDLLEQIDHNTKGTEKSALHDAVEG